MVPVIARSEATKQSSFLRAKLDCFPSLAMTNERSFLLPQSRKAAEARQIRFAAEARQSRQIRQAGAEACGKVFWECRDAARPGAARHFLRQRLHLLGRGHAAAKPHGLRDAGHRAALALA